MTSSISAEQQLFVEFQNLKELISPFVRKFRDQHEFSASLHARSPKKRLRQHILLYLEDCEAIIRGERLQEFFDTHLHTWEEENPIKEKLQVVEKEVIEGGKEEKEKEDEIVDSKEPPLKKFIDEGTPSENPQASEEDSLERLRYLYHHTICEKEIYRQADYYVHSKAIWKISFPNNETFTLAEKKRTEYDIEENHRKRCEISIADLNPKLYESEEEKDEDEEEEGEVAKDVKEVVKEEKLDPQLQQVTESVLEPSSNLSVPVNQDLPALDVPQATHQEDTKPEGVGKTEESELSPSQENLKDDTVTEVKLDTVDPYAKVVNFRAYYNGDNEGTGNFEWECMGVSGSWKNYTFSLKKVRESDRQRLLQLFGLSRDHLEQLLGDIMDASSN